MILEGDTGQKNLQILSSMMGKTLLKIESKQEDPKWDTSQKQGKSTLGRKYHSAHVRKPSKTRKFRKEQTIMQLANCPLGKV